jgi:integrase/recombinase XerD
MVTTVEVLSLPVTVEGSDVLRRAVAGYLARYKGLSRSHTESDLRVFLGWYTERGLDPLQAQRPHMELYIRWMQEVRRFKPSTVSRRISIVAGFYRTCASTRSSRAPRPSTSAGPTCHPSHRPSG